MKKIFVLITLVCCLILNPNFCSAKDVWVYNYSNGNSLYIVYESVVYGIRTGFYAKVSVKYATPNGTLIKNERLEFNHDEGDWWYGKVDVSGDSRRVYDYADATEVLNWLKEHKSEAHRTSRPYEMVLGD